MKPGDTVILRVSRKHSGRIGTVRKLNGAALLVELQGDPPDVIWTRRTYVEVCLGRQSTERPIGHLEILVPAG